MLFADLFVAKYGSDGTLLWTTSAGGDGYDSSRAIAVDPRGNSYVTGHFDITATFGAGEANETVLDGGGGGHNLFVAKYRSDGTLLWATSAGGDGPDHSRGIAVDPRGNSYVTGYFSNTATFGAGEDNETVLGGGGGQHLFVVKYGPGGTLLWATGARGFGRGIAVDPRGNSYVTGFFFSTTTFGAGEDNETVLEAEGLSLFVAKYRP